MSTTTAIPRQVHSTMEVLETALLEKQQAFRTDTEALISGFLDALTEDEQLVMASEAATADRAVAMQAFANSRHESVQRVVLEWVERSYRSGFIAALLTQSKHEQVSDAAAEEVRNIYREEPQFIVDDLLSFT